MNGWGGMGGAIPGLFTKTSIPARLAPLAGVPRRTGVYRAGQQGRDGAERSRMLRPMPIRAIPPLQFGFDGGQEAAYLLRGGMVCA